MTAEFAIWTGFILLVCGLLAIDLGLLHKQDEVITFKMSIRSTLSSVMLSMLFGGAVWFLYDQHIGGLGTHAGAEASGGQAFMSYLAGYVVEYSLSVDNIFVIALLIRTFQVPDKLQHRVLFWGILGALLLRGVMIGVGAALLHQFAWMMYVFGGILVLTAIKMALSKEDEEKDLSDSIVVRTIRRFWPVTETFHGRHFFVRVNGRQAVTPLFVVLLLVESTDVLFAVDSIPAVFAVTQDPFLVFTSNVFAIMGLRSLYFAVAGLLRLFHYLKVSLVVLLGFIGTKMLAHHYIDIPIGWSLLLIVLILAAGVVASILKPQTASTEKGHP